MVRLSRGCGTGDQRHALAFHCGVAVDAAAWVAFPSDAEGALKSLLDKRARHGKFSVLSCSSFFATLLELFSACGI